MPFTTLISASELAAHTTDSNWLIVDCRFDLANPDSGELAYREGHIPGAVYAHLDRDLSSPITPETGRHPLPNPERFAQRLGEWGVSPTTQVVAYDADTGAVAARLWWLLRWIGHDSVAVLDGGLRAWREAGLSLSTDTPMREPSRFIAHPNRDAWLSADEVAERVRAGWRLLDARAPERFAGKVEPIDPVAGHVPGAHNHPFSTNLGPGGRFLSADELRKRYEAVQAGVPDDRTIAMCGSGVTACHLLLAMEAAGKKGARLYAGSWSEWIRDQRREKAIGDSG
jgi:thiosulfate/3-mercaptopyruvate sulfurtransferase